jgi:hypothetical protein
VESLKVIILKFLTNKPGKKRIKAVTPTPKTTPLVGSLLIKNWEKSLYDFIFNIILF